MKYFFSICISLFVCLLFLSACGSNSSVEMEKLSITEPVATSQEYDPVLENLSCEYVMETVHDYLDKYYKQMNVCGDDFPGQTLNYDVYYSKSGYIIVKIRQEEEECKDSNGTYHIGKDYTIRYEMINSKEQFDKLVNDPNLLFLDSGELYVKTDSEVTYEDYQGKEEKLEEIRTAIYSHYFDYDEDYELSGRPIFHEWTNAEKIYLLDFDEGTKTFHLIVITKDQTAYHAYATYSSLYEKYEFREEIPTSVTLGQMEDYRKTKEGDLLVADFIDYYDYVMMHTACVVEP